MITIKINIKERENDLIDVKQESYKIDGETAAEKRIADILIHIINAVIKGIIGNEQ